jgi:predicted nucleic acid-binding Zn ribbon protein
MCRQAAHAALGVQVFEVDEPPDPEALAGHRACEACGERIPEGPPASGQLVLDGFAPPRGRGMPPRYCSKECRRDARNGRRRKRAD